MIASLPMYDADPKAVAALWRFIVQRLERDGIEGVPAALQWPDALDTHWVLPDLLLSQTCGYPLATALRERVQLLGAFHYAVAGCDGPRYSSVFVARHDDRELSIGDFEARVLAINSHDSQSGYRSVFPVVRSLGRAAQEPSTFFGEVVASGAHRRSMEWVRAGRADVAAIDVVTLAGLKRVDPRVFDGLAVIGSTPQATGLPLITSLRTPPATVEALKRALSAVEADPSLAAVRTALFIERFEDVGWPAYEPLAA